MTDAYRTDCVKAKGCPWQMWSGVCGISEKLVAFDGDSPVGSAAELSTRARKALANHMITLWTRFGNGEAPDSDDDGCPKGDPDCLGNNGDCHDACSTFAEREARRDG